jgi:hypothetical protein
MSHWRSSTPAASGTTNAASSSSAAGPSTGAGVAMTSRSSGGQHNDSSAGESTAETAFVFIVYRRLTIVLRPFPVNGDLLVDRDPGVRAGVIDVIRRLPLILLGPFSC